MICGYPILMFFGARNPFHTLSKPSGPLLAQLGPRPSFPWPILGKLFDSRNMTCGYSISMFHEVEIRMQTFSNPWFKRELEISWKVYNEQIPLLESFPRACSHEFVYMYSACTHCTYYVIIPHHPASSHIYKGMLNYKW